MKNYISKLIRLHSGRSFFKLALYVIVLLPLAFFSISFEFLRDLLDVANDKLINVGSSLQRWAYAKRS
jgi:hypothetical protein